MTYRLACGRTGLILLALHIPLAAAVPRQAADDSRSAQVDALFAMWDKAGSQSAYSNANCVVLAELIQRATGKSLATLSQERLFAPLKMQSTRYGASANGDPADLANSYLPSAPGQFVPVPRALQTFGDGNLLTTVRDLARWDENFYANRVGGKALVQLMRTAATLTNGERVPYGFGLMLGEYRGVPMESHGGSYHGFRTELVRFPQQHFSVSVLCNVATANASALATQVADIYLADVLQARLSGPTSPWRNTSGTRRR